MSFDLWLWNGSAAGASRVFDSAKRREETGLELEPLPIDRLVASFRRVFADDVRVIPFASGVEIAGRGWELSLEGRAASIHCSWSLSGERTAIASFVEAVNACGCSLFDPQEGAYWPAFAGLGRTEDPWSHSFFDEFHVADEADDDAELVLRSVPMRLCPAAFERAGRCVTIGLELHDTVQSALLRPFVSLRAKTYRERFGAASLLFRFSGDAASQLDRTEVERWLTHADATAVSSIEPARSVAFAVAAKIEASEIVERIDPCPFELLVVSEEERILQETFDEDLLALFVVVPRRIAAAAPSILRSALAALHAEVTALAERTGAGAVRYFDLSGRAGSAGSNLGWLETLVGLDPSEPPRDASTAPREDG